MPFVTAQPEALAATAARLEGLGAGMAAENAAAAAPTTSVIPAASDPVSSLQAAAFSAYGTLYQSIAEQAHAVHQQFVRTLQASSGSYAETEGINQASATLNAASPGNPIEWLSVILGGPSPSLNDKPLSLSGNAVNLVHTGMTNWVAAASDLLGMTGGGLIPTAAGYAAPSATSAITVGAAPAALVNSVNGPTAGPISTGMGQAAAAGKLSVPPSWAKTVGAVQAGETGTVSMPEPQSASLTTIPAGMPAIAMAGRAGGYGKPRYGIKPTVMGKPPAV